MSEIVRASIAAIKEESTVGTLVVPTSASDFIPLMAGGSNMQPNIENLKSEELQNDIGQAKGFLGIENPTGKHKAYIKHTGTAGTAPLWALLLKSALGNQTDYSSEYAVVTADATSVDVSNGSLFAVGQALLVKDTAAGRNYSIRNIASIVANKLGLNFNLANSPATSVQLGKANLISPASSGHKSFSMWMYDGNAGAVQAIAGARTNNVTINLSTGKQAEADFSYEGTSYYFDPKTITATTKYIDFVDGTGTHAVALTEKTYKSAKHLASEVATKLDAASSDTITASWGDTTGLYSITSNGTIFQLLWNSGTNNANSADIILGFSADNTGAVTYTSSTAASYAAAYTPSYDTVNSDSIIVKNAELLLGSGTDTTCMKASDVTITVANTTTAVNSLCSESGLLEKTITGREVTLTATVLLEKHKIGWFYSFITNESLQAMCNIGVKDDSGNWVAGKCFNIYFGNCTVAKHELGGDEFVQISLDIKGFVTSNRKDIYINFI
jgi:hypothetical protein